jgi:hypothetical protein
LKQSFLLEFTMAPNSALFFWIPLVFEFLLGISETFLRSMSELLVEKVLLLDALQLLMLIQMYFEQKLLSLKHIL